MTKYLYPDLSRVILDSANKVHSTLSCGLPESCYQEALMIELASRKINSVKESVHKVYYAGQQIGYFKSDIIVNDIIILELKAVDFLSKQHTAQLLNYLKITGLKVGFLFNFGGLSLEMKRLIL